MIFKENSIYRLMLKGKPYNKVAKYLKMHDTEQDTAIFIVADEFKDLYPVVKEQYAYRGYIKVVKGKFEFKLIETTRKRNLPSWW